MTRKTHCKICRKEIDESTRQQFIQECGAAVCSIPCMLICNSPYVFQAYKLSPKYVIIGEKQDMKNERYKIFLNIFHFPSFI